MAGINSISHLYLLVICIICFLFPCRGSVSSHYRLTNTARNTMVNAITDINRNERNLASDFRISASLYGGTVHQREPTSFYVYCIYILDLINPITSVLRLIVSLKMRLS